MNKVSFSLSKEKEEILYIISFLKKEYKNTKYYNNGKINYFEELYTFLSNILTTPKIKIITSLQEGLNKEYVIPIDESIVKEKGVFIFLEFDEYNKNIMKIAIGDKHTQWEEACYNPYEYEVYNSFFGIVLENNKVTSFGAERETRGDENYFNEYCEFLKKFNEKFKTTKKD